MSFQVTFEADAAHLQGVLLMLEDKLNPLGLAEFMDATVDPFLRMRTEDRFAQEGDDVVGSWQPLQLATQQIRASKGFSPAHPINVRTGKMRNFLVNRPADVKPNGFGATLTYPGPIGDSELFEKLSTAQGGKSYPSTPPRPVIGVNENDMLFVTSELVAWLMEGYI